MAPTAADARDVMVEGESGILCDVRPGLRASVYEPTKRKVTWPNGAMAMLFSAEEPERFAGPSSRELRGSMKWPPGKTSKRRGTCSTLVCGLGSVLE